MKKDLLTFNDLTRDDVHHFLARAAALKAERRAGVFHYPLRGKSLGMIFNKHSTRTRISFEVGMNEMGGHSLFLTGDQLQLKRGESLKDSARVLSRYLHGLLIRTYNHDEVVELARWADIPVINGLTDLSHPVQVLSDLFTIQEKLSRLDGVKVAYVGDGNNVTYSWILAASLMGMHLSVATPPGCRPLIPETRAGDGVVEIMDDPQAAVKNADVIYTDVWVSMGQEESEEKIRCLKPYQINQQLVEATGREPLVMHCLPAHRELEITSEVMDGKHSVVFDQAENRLHVQKAILETLLSR